MSGRKSVCTGLILILILSLPLVVSAGTIRHDRAQALYLDTAALPNYDCVGRIDGVTSSYSFLASGTLIAENWVLTAGHVVGDATSLTFRIGGSTYLGDSWVAHPRWNGDLLGGYDIGLLKLSSAVAGVTPAVRYSGSDELDAVGTSAGYGLTGTGLTGATTFDGQKRAGNNVVDSLYGANLRKARILLSDFDNPLDPFDSVYGSSSPLDLEYLIAPGDSGGGLFVDTDSGLQLAGVHSFIGSFDGNTNADYGDVSGDTRVSMFNKWIDDVLSGKGGTGGGKGNGKGHGRPASWLNDAYLYQPLATYSPTPEPTTTSLLILAGVAWLARRRR